MEVPVEPQPVVEEASIPEAPVAAEPQPVKVGPSSGGSSVQEVDLSDEWASMLEDTHPAEPAAKPPAARPPEPPAPPVVAAVPVAAEEFSIPEAPGGASKEVAEFELSADAPVAAEQTKEGISAEIPVAEPEPPPPPPPATKPKAKAEPQPKPQPKKPAPEPEFELEQEYELVLEAEPLVPAYDQKPPDKPLVVPKPEPEPEPAAAAQDSAAPTAGGFASDQFLADLANEIDQLGIGELTPTLSESPKQAAPPPKAEKPAAPVETGPLKEVFDEFRAELGEMSAEDEDLETHYNLGIAFREMGLVDEAISEFQKVAKATENGKPFRYGMQCCTLLGLAFMDKGQPGIAAIWYERALHTPGIEPESVLALRYDLGVAQESAGEPDAALKSFSQVYAMNIDYRDVADRIAALQKPIR
jgi:tetratricopeptide (TPR) repeat protein